jgi:hypothetical protein
MTSNYKKYEVIILTLEKKFSILELLPFILIKNKINASQLSVVTHQYTKQIAKNS